jgi:OmpA-OmpF porin, OOP family
MGPLRRVCSGATVGLLLAMTAAAHADSTCDGPLSPCINDDSLWPHAGPSRFVQVGSTETVPRGQLGFGLIATYLSRPIIFQLPSPGGAGSYQYAVNQQANATFLWAYGVTDHLELDVALPITLIESGAGLGAITGGTGLKDTAVRDMRFGFAYEIVPHRDKTAYPTGDAATARAATAPSREWGLAGRFELSAPTGDHDQFAGESTAVFVPSVAADYRHPHGLIAGLEVGARLRPTTDLLTARVGSQLVLGAGAGYEILADELLTVAFEAWALPTLVAQGDGGHIVPAEWQLSARTVPLARGDLSVQLSGGGPFASPPPITTPEIRFTLGVRWAPVGRDASKAPR